MATYTQLAHKVSVYVPSLQGDGQSVDNRPELLDDVCYRLTAVFGGATVTEALGYWASESGQSVKESISIATSHTDKLDESKLAAVLAIVHHVKEVARQESVAFELDTALCLL